MLACFQLHQALIQKYISSIIPFGQWSDVFVRALKQSKIMINVYMFTVCFVSNIFNV